MTACRRRLVGVAALTGVALDNGRFDEAAGAANREARPARFLASFDTEAPSFRNGTRSSGLGLSGAKERLRVLGGKLVVRSAPGEGTRAEVHVPLDE